MKCRKKNSERTFLKVENTEAFWEELKKVEVKVVMINEKGIIVSDSVSKNFVEFGEYLLISNDGLTEVCSEEDFNWRYEIVNDDKTILSDEKLGELQRCTKQFVDEMKKIAELFHKTNISFGEMKNTANFDKILDGLKKNISDIFNSDK